MIAIEGLVILQVEIPFDALGCLYNPKCRLYLMYGLRKSNVHRSSEVPIFLLVQMGVYTLFLTVVAKCQAARNLRMTCATSYLY